MRLRTALVTRPREDAVGVSRELEDRGFAVRVEPLLDIRIKTGLCLDLTGVQGFLATSANGVRALAANCPDRALPVWAVGDVTARMAQELGFTHIHSAKGDAETLAALVGKQADPSAGTLLHAAGTKVAGDVSGKLAALGFAVRREILYDAVTAEALSDGLIAALEAKAIDLALFFSPRTAATFATLARLAEQGDMVRAVTAYALSAAVAQELAVLPWRAIHIAAKPEQASLLATIDETEGNI